MSSALEARPRLRDDLTIVRREHQGKVHFVVKQPEEDKYYRFGEAEVALMRQMNGERTPAEIAEAAADELGGAPAAGQVADFAHKLKRLGVVERTPAEKHLMLMERLRSQRRVRAGRRTKGSLLRLRFSIGDPDRFFEWFVARFPWFWSRPFVLGSLALFAVYAAIVAMRWEALWDGTVGLYTLSGFGLWDWALVYGIFLVIGAIHELGHGLTTKYFGGEVHEIGAMLLYFSPALFCNTNDAWTFEKRAHRLWVTFGGPWIQLILAALAAIAWVLTEPGTFVHRLAFLAVLVGGVSAVLANMNPLIPLDGYYALSDWLEIPNLRRRAFEYWSWLGRHYLLGIDAAEPKVTPRERRALLIYGGLAIVYSAFVMAVSLFWLIAIFGRFIGPWIWVVVVVIALRLILRLAGRSRTLARAAATTWRAGFLGGGRAWALLVAILLLIGLPFVLPWTFRSAGPFRVEPATRAWIRPEVGGVLDRLPVRDGDTVRAGAVLAGLWNPELEHQFLARQGEVERLRLVRARAEADGDLSEAARAASVLEKREEELAVLSDRREQLRIRAPFDGIVLTYRLRERLGESVDPGELLLELASLEGRRARVRLPLKEAGEVAPGQPVHLKLSARPRVKLRSRVATVAAAAEEGWLELVVPLSNGAWQPAPGMKGTAKVATRRSTVAGAILRYLRRTIRLDLWL